jgi:hypothetical protein
MFSSVRSRTWKTSKAKTSDHHAYGEESDHPEQDARPATRILYVYCSTILTLFYLVFKAAKALIDVIRHRAKEAYPSDNPRPVRLLIY